MNSAYQIAREYFESPTYTTSKIVPQNQTTFLDYTVCQDPNRDMARPNISKGIFFNLKPSKITQILKCLDISASELIRQVYIRLFVIAGDAHFRRLSSPESIDSHFRPIEHPRFGCCFSMRWSKDMLDAGIYYTGMITYEHIILILMISILLKELQLSLPYPSLSLLPWNLSKDILWKLRHAKPYKTDAG